MLNKFLKDPYPNSVAVVVLVALIAAWILSLALVFFSTKRVPSGKGWFSGLLAGLTLLGIPSAFDLLQTSGLPLVFALIASLALAVHMVASTLLANGKLSHPLVRDWLKWGVLVLTVGGLAVAGYLAFVESTQAQVICGPSKGCSDVQNSKYAVLFGILPVGVLGVMGYLAILAGWTIWQYGPAGLKKWGSLAIWGCSLFGVFFSAYLTFLEPFVIGATCMWCILSAVFMILLLLISTPPAQEAMGIE